MDRVNITIVGAGVIGLAVARELAKDYQDIFVIEKNSTFGQETSSRNSEVIHAGIYYPAGSLKAETCVEGKHLLYEYCQKNNIGYSRIGKLIVALNDQEARQLPELLKRGSDNGLKDLAILSKAETARLEPQINALASIYSPSTGILDSHRLTKTLALETTERGAEIICNTEFTAAARIPGGFEVGVEDKTEGAFSFQTRILVNCAGLYSDKVSAIAGIKEQAYRLYYSKGDYFRIHNNKGRLIKRLIYPVPRTNSGGLGIHATLDLASGLRLGPDDQYIAEINYDIDNAKAKDFYESVKGFLPFIALEDLSPDTSGIRPKLSPQVGSFRDFIIKEESDNGLPGFINLIGIESPGLTASLSIAKKVKRIVDGLQ